MNTFLEFRSLTKRYGSVAALDEVTLTIERGSVLAVLGPNGAGKSTLFGCLLDFTRPTSGTILRNGTAVGPDSLSRVGYMPERIALYPHSTVRENGLFFAQLKGQPATEFERQLKRVGLSHVQDHAVRKLSKGMLQRLGLATALCGEPELLVLDEPFNGLDPALLETLQGILLEEYQRGATLLISTHTMSAVEPLTTAVAVLLEGKLAACGDIDDLRRNFGETSLEAVYRAVARRRQIIPQKLAA